MVINTASESEITALLLDAKKTVSDLEDTTVKMHSIINDSASPVSEVIHTRSPNTGRRTSYEHVARQIITFIVVWSVLLSFMSISMYHFTKSITVSVNELSTKVVAIQQVVNTRPATQDAMLVPPPTCRN